MQSTLHPALRHANLDLFRIVLALGLMLAFASGEHQLMGQNSTETDATAPLPPDDPHWLEGLAIRNVGPAGMSGRVTSIDAVRQEPNTIYIGTASGGVWKSRSGGIHWEPVFDRQPLQSIGAVAIAPSNPSIVWAGTGEGNPRNSHNSGGGIFLSRDAGRSWRAMGLEATRNIHRIVVDPRTSERVFVGAMGSAWGPHPERGVYRSTDGGSSWEAVLQADDSTGCADLVMDPGNPDKLFAALWSFGRKPWTFRSGGPGSGLFMTLDGGDSWQKINRKGSGLPEGELGRIGLAIAPSDPDIVYAWVEAKENALYRSEDGGFTWKKRGTEGIGNRPFYYADIYVDPANENRIYSIYSMISRSEDGGKSWEVIVPYSGVHPDHHAFYVHPDNPALLMNGNDGGFNISHDRGANWRFAENLPLAQYYHIAVDNDQPYHIYGGMQDNGSWVGPAYVWQSGGIRNANWQEVLFGDGFDVQPHPENNRYGYAMWQGGNLMEYDRETGHRHRLVPTHPEGEELRFNWNAALALDPHNPDAMYFGSQFLHHSTDRGRTWTLLSPDLTTDDSSRQLQHQSGGLTIDATGAENFTALTAIAPSPVEQGVVWTGSDDGLLHLTRDGGASWTELSARLPGFPAGAWIPQLVASPHAAGEAFVVANDYRRNNWEAYAWHTSDYGSTWQRIAGPQLSPSYMLSIVQDPEVADLLFLGGDRGLWFSLDRGRSWRPWSRDLPKVNVMDMAIQSREGDLVLGTFGRAAWVLDDLEPLRRWAREGATLLEQPLVFFDAPDAVLASWKQPPGVRFDADAGFRGQNRGGGARLTAWLAPDAFVPIVPAEEPTDTKGKKTKRKKDRPSNSGTVIPEKRSGEDLAAPESESDSSTSKKPRTAADEHIHAYVFSPQGDTIRHFKVKADTGFVRFGWDLRRKGGFWPNRNKPDPKADDPAGRHVAPGTYGMVLEWTDAKDRKHRDSTQVEVLADPRMAEPGQNARRQYARMHDRWLEQVETVAEGVQRIREMREAMDRMKANTARLPDSLQKQLKQPAKTLTDSLNAVEALALTPKDFKGIDGETRLTDLLWRSGSYLDDAEAPSANASTALGQLDGHVRRFADRINGLLEGPYADWKDAVEALPWSPWPELEPLEQP